MSIHQSNIIDTIHYCVNLEDDDIAHVSMFVVYISDPHFSIYSPANSQSPLSSDREQERNRRKISEKTVPVRDTYLIERPLWERRVEFWWSASSTRTVHGGQY